LLGSVHASQRTDYQRVPAIEEAIKQSQQVLFEVDLASKLSIPQRRFEAHSDFVRIDRQNAAAKTRSATNRRSAPAAITS
jgi:TraB/PrgY/gumN family